MANELIALLWRTTAASGVAILVVMAVRLPLRRACGCGVAYAAWLAVPLAALATLLPAPTIALPTLGVLPVAFVFDSTPPAPIAATSWSWRDGVALLWIVGAISMALRHVRAQRAYVRSAGPLEVVDGIAVSRSRSIGPALIGLWNPVIAVPADFVERYTKLERDLILAHERAHADARDPLVNLLAAGASCVWWFNPLVAVAFRLLRTDQELARDADVMRAHPGTRRTYAEAMLKTQTTSPPASSLVCRWEPRHPLKERLMNLSRTPSHAASRIGRVGLALALSCGAYAAWAQQGPADRAAPNDDAASSPEASAAARRYADWEHARPSSTVSVTPGPTEGQFLVSARIVDLATSRVLGTPRLLTRAGIPATIETGSNKLLVRIVVTVNPSGREAAYTHAVLRDGQIESSQSTILVIDAGGVAQPVTTPTAEAKSIGGASDDRQFEFKLTFSSTDRSELSCVADVFDAEGKADLAEAMRGGWDGKRHKVSFRTVTPTVAPDADRLVASLSKCQLGKDSRLTWSVGRRAV